ncbi:MAG: sensor histidine kinase [Flavobacteriales bacterium]|nr:sensor histidine kinase [Flavobacteriales bacterium]
MKLKQVLFDYNIPTSKRLIKLFRINYLNKCNQEEFLKFKYLETLYFSTENKNIALKIINSIVKKYGNLNQIIIADFYVINSNILTSTSRQSESIVSLEKALSIYRKLNAADNISRVYLYLSYEYIKLKDYDNALKAINKSIYVDSKRQVKSKLQFLDEHLALGKILFFKKNYEEAILVFNEVIKENKELGFIDIFADAFYYKNLCLYKLKEYDKGIANCLAELKKDYFIEDMRFTINYLLILNYNKLSKFKEAKLYLDQTTNLIKNNPKQLDTDDLLAFLDASIETEKGIGDINKALAISQEYMNRYKEHNDSINYSKIAASHTSFNIKEKELQLKDLTIKSKVNALKLEKLNNERILLWIIILSSIIILSAIILFLKKLSKKNKELSSQNIVIEANKSRIELLLKELHHRTKNNLQLIISMLKIQARSNKYIDVNEFIEVNRNRISSMAMIHQYLYLNEALSNNISLKNYTEDLVSAIKSTFEDKNNISISLQSDNISCEVNIAVALGLIINELTTNSLKYAFTEDRNGRIEITIQQLDNDNVQLSYNDNGVGFETKDIKSGSFGISLVNLLVAQIQGIIKYEKGNGVNYQIHFPISKNHEA